MLQYYSSLFSVIDDGSEILHMYRLTQQFIVDAFLRIETNNLNYIKSHQPKLKSELYCELQDQMNDGNNNKEAKGKRVILPSTFPNSPRNMHQKCADAMSIFFTLWTSLSFH
ncbi:hypothetical protein EIN_124670 [Entamoeba invadens IP1]|uniref:Helitron helicase-like domain-containing protein n=1 Tax=Entamoeba invadens IP1 TaxID=370355 RepID=L7FJF0_ENTIV|nr:hypothetical protein EIN_124670 [Entamoeba invadens IP1]ELP83986.1 hypothetical protein EIN_124670 [Entamoeba invadens IP1]|eukprot:XP_004183332.1 hypothetical protein EIN_124670 [Entamoeba invadens IP1]